MHRYNNSYSESTIRGGYVPFLLKRDIDQASLKGAVQELNIANRTALQQRGAVLEALAKANLNPADSEWRDQYAQDVQAQIEQDAIGGSYAKALPTAIRVAGEVASNPELLAREKANKEYQTRKGIVDTMVASGKLPDRIAQQWLEENPYKFEPIRNKDGKVIGGKEWRPNWNPVEPVDMTQVYAKIGQLAGEEAGGSQNVRFVDENGRAVSNPASGMYAMEIKSGSTWRRMPASKLRELFKSALDQIPGAKETFEQDYNNKLWQYNKATEEGKKSFYDSDIMDSQGNMRTLNEYIKYKSDPVFEKMAYNNVTSTIDYSTNTAYFKARDAANTDSEGSAFDKFMATLVGGNSAVGRAINIPMDKELSNYYGSTTSALNTIKSIFNKAMNGSSNPIITSPVFTGYIQRGDYDTAAKYLQNAMGTIKDEKDRAVLEGAIRRLKTDGNAYNDMIAGMDKDDINVLNTYAALTTGGQVLDAKDNKYSRNIAHKKNNIFGYHDSKLGKTLYADKIGLAMEDESVLNQFIKNLGVDKNKLSQHGIHIIRNNDGITLDIDKSTDLLPAIGKALETADATRNERFNFSNIFKGTFGKDKISIIKYDKDGNPLRRNTAYAGTYDAIRGYIKDFSPTSDYSNNLQNKVNAVLTKYNKTMTITPNVLGEKSFKGKVLKEEGGRFGLKRTDIHAYDTDLAENDRNLILNGLTHIGDFRTWDENGDIVSPKDVKELQEYLNSAIAENKFIPLPSIIPTETGYGWQIVIPDFKNKKGDVQKGKTIFVEGLVSDVAAQYLSQSQDAMYNRGYQQARAIEKDISDIYNNPIIYDRGNEVQEKAKYIATLKLEEAYDDIEQAVMNDVQLSPQVISISAYKIVANHLGINDNQFDTALQNGTINQVITQRFTEKDIAKVKQIETDLNNKYINLLTNSR